MNELVKVFENSSFGSVRVVMRDGEPWFVAKDICECLSLTDVSASCNRLDEDEKVVLPRSEVSELFSETSSTPSMTLVSESGLYTLIMRSNKEEAKPFRKWVTGEVLPSIRKTGSYSMAPKSYAEALRALAAEVEEKEKAQLALEAEKEQHAKDNQDWCNGFDILNQKKAEINSRQLATAMATASAKSRENEKLREQIGESKNWKSVRSISWLEKYFDVKKHNPGIYTAAAYQLQKICKENNWERHEIEDSLWGKVKTYPQCAIDVFEKRVEADNTIMIRYRYGYEEC
jgi:prophage antirepressor-like protein